MFASYAVFGHRRPLNARDRRSASCWSRTCALTLNDQLALPRVVQPGRRCSCSSGRTRFDEQSDWLRRRIGDPASISSVYLRGGTVFIAVAVVGVARAHARPRRPRRSRAPGAASSDGLIERVPFAVQRFLPTGGATRSFGVASAPTRRSASSGTTDDVARGHDPARARPTSGDYYWRAVTYDRFDSTGWRPVSAGADRGVAGRRGRSSRARRRRDPRVDTSLSTFTVTPGGFTGTTILSPETPTQRRRGVRRDRRSATTATSRRSIGRTATAPYTRHGPRAGQGRRAGAAQRGGAPGCRHRLSAGDHATCYLGVARSGHAVGPDARGARGQDPRRGRRRRRPYRHRRRDRGRAPSRHASHLRHRHPRHRLRRASRRSSASPTFKQGFCQYYAATMAVHPPRPGHPDPDRAGLPARRARSEHRRREIRNSATRMPGSRSTSRATAGCRSIRPAAAVAVRSRRCRRVRPVASGSPRPVGRGVRRRAAAVPATTTRRATRTAGAVRLQPALHSAPLIAVTILLAADRRRGLAFVGLAARAARRDDRGRRVRDVARLAVAVRVRAAAHPDRLRVRRRARGGAAVARPELETVARAKVEVVYGRGRSSGEDRLRSLREAQRRLRVGAAAPRLPPQGRAADSARR